MNIHFTPAVSASIAGTVTVQTAPGSPIAVTTEPGDAVVVTTAPGAPLATVDNRNSVTLLRYDYSAVPVTTAAYVQVIAATPADLSGLYIFDSSGQTLVLAAGAPGSEVDLFQIVPGGNNQLPEILPAGTRLSVKAISADAVDGELTINYLA